MRVSLCLLVLASLLLTNFVVITDQNITNEFEGDSKLSIIRDNKLIQNNNNDILSGIPMIFTENRGQLENEQVRYYANNGVVWFTDDGVWFKIREELSIDSQESRVGSRESDEWFEPMGRFREPEPVEYKRVILKQEFVSASLVRPEGRERVSWNSNFFYGNDSSKWCTEVPNYMEVYYESLYDGIDLRYYTNEKGLKYDFIVHPGADVSQIRLKYEGGDEIEVNELGNLVIETAIENVIEEDPVIYQNRYWGKGFINGGFIKFNKDEYGFELFENYSKENILVIDPQIELEYSTYIGGTMEELGYGIEVDSQGNAYISGPTQSSNYPTTPGANETQYVGSYDVVITKLNSMGSSLLYSTYLGGTGNDYGNGIAIDSNGNAYVTGRTWSSDFPVTSGAYITSYNSHWDIFVTKLNAVGSILDYSTYMGHNNADYGMAIAVDPSGNAYVTGYTFSHLFPTTPGAFDDSFNQYSDCYVFKLNHNGSKLLYSTYVGGDIFDYAYDIEVDDLGDAFVVGLTRSTNFPYTSNAYDTNLDGNFDSFIFRLNSNASKLNYSTFLGGSSNEIGYSIAVDTTGNAYVTGYTDSINFPTLNAYDKTNNGGRDIFVTKLATNRSKLFYSTYLGGTNTDEGRGITVDNLGNAFVTGETLSTDFNITSDAYDSILNGSKDAFLSKFNSNGSKLMYSTYLGGNNYETGYRIALDPYSNAYIAGGTYSSDFPITPAAFNKSYKGAGDIFVSKFSFQPILSITSLSLLENNQQTSTIYSRLCPYNFRVKVIDSVSINDLEKVYLTLDPEGYNIQLSWDRVTGQFLKLSDSQNYVSINSSSKGDNYYNIWTIDFNLEFNWEYPDEELHNVQAIATSATLSPTWFNVTGFYNVENDIVFEGESILKNKNGKLLAQNELVRGGEKLTWMGLTPVYEGTIDVYPREDEFDIAICDDCDNTWVCSPNTGEQLFNEIFTPNSSYSSFNYSLSICGIPPACDNTSEMFTLRIDADNLTFSEIIPNDRAWQTVSDITVGVTITDIGGGVVNSSTVRYAISRNNGTSWDNWDTVPNLESATSIQIRDIVSLRDGKNNLIKWKAADSVGNGPIESEPSRILVDTEGIKFYNGWPSATAVSTSELVELGITVADGISGVNASTIKYSISKDGGKSWEPWVAVEGYDDKITIDVHINLTFPNGTNNMIKWRATDVAGNTPVESPPYTINVNTWTPAMKPVVRLVSPLNAMVINRTEVELVWELEDTNLRDVKYDVCLDKVNPPGEYRVGLTDIGLNVSKLLDSMTYYWRIVSRYADDLRNTYKSDVWWFKVDLGDQEKEQIFKLKITGPDRLSMKQGENRTIQVSITNLGNSDDRVDLELQAGIFYEIVELEDYSILEIRKNGVKQVNLKIDLPLSALVREYKIEIIATSLNSEGKVSANYTIILDVLPLEIEPSDVDNDDQDKSNDGLYIILSIILVIIIVIVGVFLFYYNRKRQKEREVQTGRTITTKPLPSQVINVGELPQSQGPQVAAITTQQTVPTVIGVGSQPQPQALTSPSPTVTGVPQPTLVQTPQVTPVPQVVQIAQVPQLPPAKNETQTTQYDSVDVPGGEVTVPTQTVPEPAQAQETQAAQMDDEPATSAQPSTPTISSEPQNTQEGQNQNSIVSPTVSLPGQEQNTNQVHLPGGTEPGDVETHEQQSSTPKDRNRTNDV